MELEVATPLIHILRVEMPLDATVINKLFTHAKQKGIDSNTLIRMWILENIAKLEKRQAA